MSDRQAASPRWHGFWNFNVGHVLIICGMVGGPWVVLNGIETTLTDHGTRITALENALTVQHRENAGRLDQISAQLNDLTRDVSRMQGQLMLLQVPQRRGDIAPSDQHAPEGGG